MHSIFEVTGVIDRPHPTSRIVLGRKVTGISAILLPFHEDYSVDWDSFRAHVARTVEAGLTPAVNMDTGYANLIDEPTRLAVLRHTEEMTGGGEFTAGAFVASEPGDAWSLDEYRSQIDAIESHGGTPIIFQSFGMTTQEPPAIVDAYRQIAECCEKFIAFELGKMFTPFGAIYDLTTYEALLQIPQCIGAKHSSLSRELEWQRLEIRDRVRPDFKVFTGNDLAIDMVMYGSDYLLGISTFAPDLFAKRDVLWERGDAAFYELNDLLQYLGFLAFRPPTPAYKHNAAQFLKLQGWIKTDLTHPNAPQRPASDIELLEGILGKLNEYRET